MPPSLPLRDPMHVDVSVLIPVRDEEQHLHETVAAMRAQDFDGAIELLFADGRSDDRTVAILRELQADDPRIRILDNPGRTVTHGLNVGLRAARGSYVARMDAHTRYPAEYLRLGVERLRQGDIDWVTGPQVPVGTGSWSRLVARALSGPLGRGSSDKWQPADDAPREVREWELSTSVFTGVWRRETLDALGGWDPEWVVNEDSEMAARVLAGGGRIVCRTDMAARYAPRDSLTGLARQYWRYGTFRARTFARHPQSCGPLRLGASLLPVGLAAALVPNAAERVTGVPVGRAGRVVAGLYALAVAGQVARLRPRPADAPRLAAVLATMHLSWGAGFLLSALRVLPRRTRIRASAPSPLSRPAT
ncbi:MAG: glycosyltransferase [Patulibacter sp.]|nr:glycosyltransferase [Patulibacter sp.]